MSQIEGEGGTREIKWREDLIRQADVGTMSFFASSHAYADQVVDKDYRVA